MEKRELLRVENIHKTFPGVKALRGVNLQVLSGEVHALMGENGAGKSTIIKCIMGAYIKDPGKGKMYIEGKEIEVENPIHAKKLGLGAVYQDVMMAKDLTVAENFFLGELPRTKLGMINWKKAHREAANVLKELKIDVDTKSKLNQLSIAKQEMVAIAKMYADKCKVAIFDEPTALLSTEETEILFDLIDRLKKTGMGIVYISHRMKEVFQISDRVTVLKDGKYMDTLNTDDTNEDEIIQLMVGRSVDDLYGIKRPKPSKEVAFEVKGLTKEGVFEDISFKVHKGEIFGMFGLVGAGRTEIVESIFGAETYDKGEIFINGEKYTGKSPKHAIKKGMGFLTEDRKKSGLYMKLPVRDNTNALSYKKLSTSGVISRRKENSNATEFKNKLDVRTPSILQLAKNLSGGNQQKVVISKWLSNESDILIIDEPTVGVDVGAKVEIYKLLEGLIAQGKSIIMISSYLPEVMGIADKIMIVSEGKNMGEIEKQEYNLGSFEDEQRFVRLASGLK